MHNTSEISTSISSRRRNMFLFSCACAYVYFTSVMLISKVQTRLYPFMSITLAIRNLTPVVRGHCSELSYYISVLFCRDLVLQFTRQGQGHVICQTKSWYMLSLTSLLAHYCGILLATLFHLDHLRK